MATSRPLRDGDLVICSAATTSCGTWAHFVHYLNGEPWFLAADFGISNGGDLLKISKRMFGIPDGFHPTRAGLIDAITNGTAPGLYVREGDDTSDWETYRQVLARRVEEAMAARRRGGAGGETTVPRATVRRFGPGPRMCSTNGLFIGVTVPYYIEWSGTAMFYVYSDGRREQTETTLEHCLNSVQSGSYVELPVDGVTPRPAPDRVQAAPTTTKQDDEIRVGDVVEVVSSAGRSTVSDDVGKCGRVIRISRLPRDVRVYLESVSGRDLPIDNVVSFCDIRKVSPLVTVDPITGHVVPSPPQTVAANVSPMPDKEAARSEAAVSDKVRRRSVVDDMRRATPRDFTATGITGYLQSLGATHIRVSQAPGAYLPVIEVAGLSQQAFDIARQNLPVGVQLRAVGGVVDPVVGVYLGPVTPTQQSQQPPVSVQLQFGGERETTASRIRQEVQRELDRLYPPSPLQSPQQPPPPPSRFSLLEVDANVKDTTQAPASQAPKASTGLAALQQELRAEREARRALAAAQTPLGRFDLLECDLPAVPVAPVVAIKSPQPSSRPTASSPPPRRPVETITDLTAARSPLELARMLEGLNDELSTMMRQREVN